MDSEVKEMKKNNYVRIASIIICLLPILAGIILYSKLPSEMPIHFNGSDIPDNYANKNIALFVLPLAMSLFQLFIIVITHIASKRVDKVPRIANVLIWLIPIITVLVYTIMLVYSLGYEISVGKYVCIAIGIIFCIIGNYMPKMSYESAKIMMHPTPKSEKSYRRIAKWYGYSFVLFGVILFIVGIFA